jgi:hypothetical protein
MRLQFSAIVAGLKRLPLTHHRPARLCNASASVSKSCDLNFRSVMKLRQNSSILGEGFVPEAIQPAFARLG